MSDFIEDAAVEIVSGHIGLACTPWYAAIQAIPHVSLAALWKMSRDSARTGPLRHTAVKEKERLRLGRVSREDRSKCGL
jgi:hypothetical protein